MAYIGNIDTGTSTGIGIGINEKRGMRHQASATFTATMIGVVTSANSSRRIRLGIYSDKAGEPDVLLGTTARFFPSVSGVPYRYIHRPLLSGVSIISGSYYWLAILVGSGASGNFYGDNAAGTARSNSDDEADGFSDPFGAASSPNINPRIYASDSVSPLVSLGDLADGGTVVEASDGTKILVCYSTISDVILIYKNIDGNPVFVDLAQGSTVHASSTSVGYIHAAIDSYDDIHRVSASKEANGIRDIA